MHVKKPFQNDITITEQIAFAAKFYLGQVFAFGRLIKEGVLKWFLPMMCKERALTGSAGPLGGGHPSSGF